MTNPAPPIFRVFVSSPDDVAAERAVARRVLERLRTEYAEQVAIERVLWEERTYSSRADFQSQIEATKECQLVIGILWSKIGYPLDPSLYSRDDLTPYESGTAFELDTAFARGATSGLPDIAIFRKEAKLEIDPLAPRKDIDAQLALVRAAMERWTRTPGGHFKAAFNTFARHEDFERKLEQHVRDCLAAKGFHPRAAIWDVSDENSPYPGLEPYEAERERVFFGRAEARERCREKLAAAAERGCAFLLILGASGSGKSSLARAGILPRLALPGMVAGVDAWRTAILRPTHAPLAALAAALFAAIPELVSGDAAAPSAWADAAAAHPPSAAHSVRAALARAPAPIPRLLLLVDQLEEMFDAEPASRASFIAALDALARSGIAWVVATLRSDRYAAAQAEPGLLALKEEGAGHDLAPPDLAEIIAAPARLAGLRFERDAKRGDLAEALLRDAAVPDSLPLLQMTLAQLFDRRDHDTLTIAAYDAIGGLEGAIGERADTVMSRADAAARAELPALLLELPAT